MSILSALIAIATTFQSRSSELILPAAAQNTKGSDSSSYPFGVPEGRIQQLYPASVFPSTAPIIEIHSVAFRVNQSQFGFLHETFDQLTIVMSTTTGQLSISWDANHGPDRKTLFSGSIHFDTDHPASGPAAFDIKIPFDTPFLYSLSAGNLLLEMSHTRTGGGAGDLDAFPFSTQLLYGGTGQLTGGMIATRFEYSVIPEPASITLLLLGFVFAIRRRN
jgi:hypothetical protein